MIDTVMVVWTSGLWKHLLRATGTFLLLFMCICILSFLITTSGSRWSGLAITVTRAGSSAQSDGPTQSSASTAPATVQAAPAPTARPIAAPYIAPLILQNPILPNSTHASRSNHKHLSHHYTSINTTPSAPTPAPDTSSQDPSNALQNLP